ncbi:MAG: DNA polymerase III subunit beta, partial [Clostridiales bacterium]|nr:DNA polymerase III subunit beta [Clostridiales bacterium]
MKLHLNKDRLIHNISLVNRAVVSKSTMNILECILLIADENGIKLISNNLDMGIETNYFEADVEEGGKIALEGKFFSEVVRSCPSQDIYLESDEKFITTFKSGKSEIKMSGRNPEVFPLLPEVSEDLCYTIEAEKLRDLIKKTIFAVASENIKPVLTGEYVEINDNDINMVGIDGYRIACGSSTLLKGNDDNFSVIVPGNAMNEISRLISDEEEIEMFFTENHMMAKFKDCTLLTSLIEGEYLKYKHFFTDDFKTRVVIRRDEVLSCLDRVLLISKDVKKSPVKVKISTGLIELSSISETLGSMYEAIDCDVTGDDLTIGFNPKYMQEIFKNIDAEEVSAIFNSSLSPCVLQGEENFK